MQSPQGYPTGIIPAVEAQWAHNEFVTAVTPDTVILKLHHARRINKRGETAASYFPDETQVITTSTIRDNQLALISWEDEYEILQQFQPDYHIPTDYSVYELDDPQQRTENIVQCMHGTLWMADQLADDDAPDIKVIPLVKGLSEIERSICYETFDDPETSLDGKYVAYYATQYYTGGQGARTEELLDDIWAIHNEYDTRILLIGILAPSVLERMPSSVVAASGQNAWRSRTKPRKQSTDKIRDEYAELTENVEAAIAAQLDRDANEKGRRNTSGDPDESHEAKDDAERERDTDQPETTTTEPSTSSSTGGD